MFRRRTQATVAALVWLVVMFGSASIEFAQQHKTSSPKSAALTIGIIKHMGDSYSEGGCLLRLPPDERKDRSRYIFASDYSDNAVMNINGKDIKLKLIPVKELDQEYKVGTKYQEDYTGPGLKVHIDYTVTWTCPPDDDSCEIMKLDATITVVLNNMRKAVKVKGVCGS